MTKNEMNELYICRQAKDVRLISLRIKFFAMHNCLKLKESNKSIYNKALVILVTVTYSHHDNKQ
jgi:hypothetical protein